MLSRGGKSKEQLRYSSSNLRKRKIILEREKEAFNQLTNHSPAAFKCLNHLRMSNKGIYFLSIMLLLFYCAHLRSSFVLKILYSIHLSLYFEFEF